MTMVISSVNTIKNGEHALIDKSKAILTRLEAVRSYLGKYGSLDKTIKEIVNDRKELSNITKEDISRVIHQVPIVGSWTIGMDQADKEHYQFEVKAVNARNAKNEATEQDKIFLERFKKDKVDMIIHNDKATNSLWVMKSIQIFEADGCLKCHGSPKTSVWENDKDVLGYQMEDWKDGMNHGMFKIISKLGPVQAQARSTIKMMIIYVCIIILIFIIISYVIVSKISNKVVRITDDLNESASELLKSSDELSNISAEMATSTQEQAAAIQETSASIEEITGMMAHSNSYIQYSGKLADEVKGLSSSSAEKMTQLVKAMENILDNNQKLKGLLEIIGEIKNKTELINEIVFQTKLLSFNASVEAERAGEHGKGFSVVAKEIGALAKLSGESADQISKIIG